MNGMIEIIALKYRAQPPEFHAGDLVESLASGDICYVMEVRGDQIRVGGNSNWWPSERFTLYRANLGRL